MDYFANVGVDGAGNTQVALIICWASLFQFLKERPAFLYLCKEKQAKETHPVKSLIFVFLQFFNRKFLTRNYVVQAREIFLKIESRKGDLYGAPNLSEHYLKSAVNFEFILKTKNILSFDRTLKSEKEQIGFLSFPPLWN